MDPFACFDDDDDEEEEEEDRASSMGHSNDIIHVRRAKQDGEHTVILTNSSSNKEELLQKKEQFIQLANQRFQQHQQQHRHEQEQEQEKGEQEQPESFEWNGDLMSDPDPTKEDFHRLLSSDGTVSINPWPHRTSSPLYMNPAMKLQTCLLLSDGVGGGRGYIATQHLPPGTLLLVEEPVATIQQQQQQQQREAILGIETLYHILSRTSTSYRTVKTKNGETAKSTIRIHLSMIQDWEQLHPTKENVDRFYRPFHDVHLNRRTDTSMDDHRFTHFTIHESQQVQIVDMMQIMWDTYSQHPLMNILLESFRNTVEQEQEKELELDQNARLLESCQNYDEIDICRMILVLRYNSFESGLYLHFSMFNHSEDANCIKYMPTNVSSTTLDPALSHWSEARTTRHVAPGEALTLHYIPPHKEVSHATRRSYLWDQHRFDIGHVHDALSSYPHLLEMESISMTCSPPKNCMQVPPTDTPSNDETTVVGNTTTMILPSSHRECLLIDPDPDQDHDGSSVTHRIEKTLLDLEEMYVEIQQEMNNSRTISRTKPSDSHTHLLPDTIHAWFERAKAFELATNECITETRHQLGNDLHILLIRCCRLHVDSAHLILSWGEGEEKYLLSSMTSSSFSSSHPWVLTKRQRIHVLGRFLTSARRLFHLQTKAWGAHHPDLARTHQDIANCISYLLSTSPKTLMGLGLEGLTSLQLCSTEECRHTKEYKRISSMYPHDVEKWIRVYPSTLQ